MAETTQQVEIPNRALFKAAEVCDLVKVQPYVLRSWEVEFKDLGVARNGSTVRVYRREDIERVLRIKHLVLIEGLTLAGVRRRLEEEAEGPLELDATLADVETASLPADVRTRIGQVRRGLRSLMDLLDGPAAGAGQSVGAGESAQDFSLTARREAASSRKSAGASRRAGESKGPSPRRKRSA